MPQRHRAPDVVRIVEGLSGRVTVRSTLRLRFDYGAVVPWMRRSDGHHVAVAGPDSVWLRSEPKVHTWGEDFSTHSEFTVEARREGRLRPHLAPLARAPSGARRPVRVAAHQRRGLAALGGPLPLRRPLQGRRRTLPDHAQGPHLPSDGRHRRRGHHLSPGGDGRHPQLGLPLLLAARLDPHPGRPGLGGLPQGGRGLARLAAARGRRRPGRPADHVRRRGRATAPRVRAAAPLRVRRFGARADRQRRRQPAPTRRLRGGDGLLVAGPARGSVAQAAHVVPAERPPGLAARPVEAAGRGPLGSARRAPSTSCTPR